MNSFLCPFVDLFVHPGLEDLRSSDVDSLGWSRLMTATPV